MSRNQWIGLGVALGLIGLAYLWVYGRDRLPPVEVMAVTVPGSNTFFSFNDDVLVEEVMVFRPAEGANLTDDLAYIEGEVMWHLVPRPPVEGEADGDNAQINPDPQPLDVIRYGRGLVWLRPAEGFRRRGKPLEPGVQYVFVAKLTEGRAQTVFTFVGDDG
ncbi:MAG: hypothetical protein AAF333_06785 [Planctomycetota bacterium]